MNTIDGSIVEKLGLSIPQTEKSKELGQDEFLKLMLAQVQHQDPFQPMENGDFLAQIAQFSTVSGIQEMQSSIQTLSESLSSNQALQASSLIGRQVLVPTDHGLLAEGGEVSGELELTGSTSEAVVDIFDASGELVRRLTLGPQAAGTASFVWDGTTQDGTKLPAGRYRLQAAADFDGEMVAVNTLISAQVDSVTLGSTTGGLVLNLSSGETLGLANVRQIM